MDRLKQIEEEIEKLEDFLSEKDDEFFKSSHGSFEKYEQLRKPYTSKLSTLSREKRMLMVPVFEEDIPDYGDVMSLQTFIDCCNSGGFIDYDGYGSYVRDGKESNIHIFPSDVKHASVRTDFNEIVWYNR